jgi:urease accessory protein
MTDQDSRGGRSKIMTPTRNVTAAVAVLALAATAAAPALAHTGLEHAASFSSGFLHPLTGPDHLLAMVAVGLWAGLNGGRAVWAWPVAFVGVMLVGGVLGMTGVALPAVESGILASVVVLGLLVLTAARVPVALGTALVGIFALLHGHAHGAELPAAASAISYSAGFALATALLHAAGLCLAFLAARQAGRLLVRGAGGLIAACGVALAVI